MSAVRRCWLLARHGRGAARCCGSSAVVLGLAAAAVWLAGVGVTTSYYHLSLVWLFLGLLLHWDLDPQNVCPFRLPPPEGAG